MNPARDEAWRWTLLVLAVCLIATTALYHTRGWIWLGVPPVGAERAPFSDAAAQLVAADACNAGAGQWIGRVCFLPDADAVTHSQSYQPWLSFQRWGLTGKQYVPVGMALVSLFYLAFGLAFRPAGVGEAALLLVFLFSAAVQLAVERANFDLLTSAIMCLAAWLLNRRHVLLAAFGCIALGVGTTLKIYSGLSCACAAIGRRSHRALVAICALSCTAAAITILGVDNILVLGHGAPEGATRFSTGAHWLWRQRGFAWMATAAITTLSVSAMAWRILGDAGAPPLARHPRRTALMQIAFLTAIPLFLLKDSYDYRFVLWLPCLALPMAILRRTDLQTRWRYFCILILGLSAFVFCIELPCMLLDRLAVANTSDFPSRAIEGLTLAKQFATWGIAGLLAVLFLHSLPARSQTPAAAAP
jgi:hypothetical protein